jgi:hypothetical protein
VLEDGRFSALRAVQQRRGGLHLSAGASLQREPSARAFSAGLGSQCDQPGRWAFSGRCV